jgi:hypothetical protein
MRRTVGGIVALLLALPALAADDKPNDQPMTPEEQYKALLKDYSGALRQVKTVQERNKLVQETSPKFLELAEKNPKDPAAVDALTWVVVNTNSGAGGKDGPRAKALALLSKEYVQSDKLGRLCQALARSRDNDSTDLLRAVLEKNPNKDVQGAACLSLAQRLKSRADGMAEDQPKEADKLRKESEELFERAADKFADVKLGRGTIGETAKTELFELRFLSVGKEAPDIEDEDIDGKKFKLSDYRGKVVLLDFWGDW